MKFSFQLLAVLILTTFLIGAAYASGSPKARTEIKTNTISSLMNGLKSDNLGLRTSSSYMIGELQISNAIIPLMKILRDDENEEARIAAALALYKIGSPMSINAVKQSIRFDESKRVSKLCSNFYNEYLRNKINDEEINEVNSNIAVK